MILLIFLTFQLFLFSIIFIFILVFLFNFFPFFAVQCSAIEIFSNIFGIFFLFYRHDFQGTYMLVNYSTVHYSTVNLIELQNSKIGCVT